MQKAQPIQAAPRVLRMLYLLSVCFYRNRIFHSNQVIRLPLPVLRDHSPIAGHPFPVWVQGAGRCRPASENSGGNRGASLRQCLYSMDRIAKGLEADGILTGAGKTKWWTSTINKILRNEKYIGDALLQKTYTTDFLNKTRVKNNGIVPQYYVEGNHEAIIPKDIFLRVQEELVRRRVVKTSANGKKRSYSCNHCALHRLSFAANAVKCSAEFTGTIAAANPSSGAASVDWSQPDRNATQESSMRWYWKMW